MSTDSPALQGISVVTIATNVPGPVTAARLKALGATVTKVEPPSGDLITSVAPDYYAELTAGQEVVTLDLKTPEGGVAMEALLSAADIFITSHRPSALARLGLDWDSVHARHPRLCHVAIVGHPGPDAEVPGHDLTYQAVNGLILADGGTPRLPATLIADLAGGERAATAALTALFARERTGAGSYWEVALSEAAEAMADPLRHGLTAPGGLLGGAVPGYAIYPTQDGFIACAALEPHFLARLQGLLGAGDRDGLAAAFRTRPAAEWVEWAREHDLPIEALPHA
ncbi:CoA transferase [Intrasporangium calvum]|uniref:CoA transferase n=1 Tax=Intrasporangium calvum TaxID=53358 RepID=A0ABT5GHT2_9MICO|nr:CoA transferase [Intrasporangium calvum]MDC5697814.1 CoA transferase [Intrasporangium calvum]